MSETQEARTCHDCAESRKQDQECGGMHAGGTITHAYEGDVIVLDDSPFLHEPNVAAGATEYPPAPTAGASARGGQMHTALHALKPLASSPDLRQGRNSEGGSAGGDVDAGTPGFVGAAGHDSPDFFGALMGSYDGFAQRRVQPEMHSQEGSEDARASTGVVLDVLNCNVLPHAWAERPEGNSGRCCPEWGLGHGDRDVVDSDSNFVDSNVQLVTYFLFPAEKVQQSESP